jgi:large subunit ribosomal protein L13
MKTYSPKAREIRRAWYVVDADGAVLGRLASHVAQVLRGKHKPSYVPNLDSGDHVVVINAAKVRLSGEKAGKKLYRRHSGYPGGLREIPFERLVRERPERVVEQAIKGMLPSTRLGRQMARKLSVYAGPDHPHGAQRPVPLPVGEIPGRSDREV